MMGHRQPPPAQSDIRIPRCAISSISAAPSMTFLAATNSRVSWSSSFKYLCSAASPCSLSEGPPLVDQSRSSAPNSARTYPTAPFVLTSYYSSLLLRSLSSTNAPSRSDSAKSSARSIPLATDDMAFRRWWGNSPALADHPMSQRPASRIRAGNTQMVQGPLDILQRLSL